MVSRKIVFFLSPSAEGCNVVKNYLKISSEMNENLAFSYISREITIKGTVMDLKIYVVFDKEKFEHLHPIYFRKINIAVLVFDISKANITMLQKVIEDVSSHNSHYSTVILGYRVNDEEVDSDLFEFLSSIKGHYFEFSGITGLKEIFEILYEELICLHI